MCLNIRNTIILIRNDKIQIHSIITVANYNEQNLVTVLIYIEQAVHQTQRIRKSNKVLVSV